MVPKTLGVCAIDVGRVGEVVLLLFFEALLEKRLTLSYVPNFQGHTMHCVEMVAV